MYKVELTRGQSWNAPVVEAHCVNPAMHIVEVERMARALLSEAQRKPNRINPDSYRIVNSMGLCVKAGMA